MSKPFKGIINVDVRDSTPDWRPYTEPTAPEGAPNVLIVLYDDTGLAAWSPYGGRINMPTHAAAGRRGPDLHAVAHDRAVLADAVVPPDGPQPPPERVRAASPRRPRATRARTGTSRWRTRSWPQVLRERGLQHVLDRQEPQRARPTRATMGASKAEWPLARGFDRFYGFIGGETDQWYPDLVEDNHYVDQPYLPEDGYHLSKDLADKAIRFIARQQAVASGQALVHVVLPGREPRPAPRPAGVHRQVQGQVRRRLRGLPRVGAARG